jgi:hypothetical protein
MNLNYSPLWAFNNLRISLRCMRSWTPIVLMTCRTLTSPLPIYQPTMPKTFGPLFSAALRIPALL